MTFQLSNSPNNSSIITQIEQELVNEQKISKQHRNVKDEQIEDNRIKDIFWEIAQNNEWYRWATFTVIEQGMDKCLLCSKSPLNKVIVVPNPHDYQKCAVFNRNFCHAGASMRPHCSAKCLGFIGNSVHQNRFSRTTLGRLV